MAVEGGLQDGNRVAIIGGGISAHAAASALLFTARARGRTLDVRIYEGRRYPEDHRAPALLTPECRSRLAALGCRIPPEWRKLELSGVEVISSGNRSLLRGGTGGLWVVDSWPDGPTGQEQISSGLAEVCTLQGAAILSRQVERVEIAGRQPREDAEMAGAGTVVVWANGSNERFHAAVLASGCDAQVSNRFFPGFQGAPTLPAAQARLRYGYTREEPWPVVKLLLNPIPGVDGVYLIPCHGSIYALGFGAQATVADLCQVLMMAARDGHLEEGFEIAHLSSTRVPAGCGDRLCAPAMLAVGPSALGHPLQLGLSETLAGCSRAAVALVESGSRRRPLEQRYLRDGIFDLIDDARAGVRALRWLRRCGDGAAEVLRKANERERSRPWLGAGVLGLPSPSPSQLASSARWSAVRRAVGGLWKTAIEPVPSAVPRLDPDLFYVVDDDAGMREGLTSLLESRGAEVVSFADELALFSAAARRPPTAILLDVVLSWVDGLSLCEELKRHPLTRDVRVVMMSGIDRGHVRERAFKAGAHAFLAKPVAPGELFQSLGGAGAPFGAQSSSSSSR